MLDLDAPIEPGRGLGGVPIGCDVATILTAHAPLRVIRIGEGGRVVADTEPEVVTIHSFGAVRTWSVAGVVQQVGAFEGYRGRTAPGIGFGSTIAEIEAAYGVAVAKDGEMLAVPGVAGLGIETTEWTTGDAPDPAATIVQMFVHDPTAG
jgi:hypothetical protein